MTSTELLDEIKALFSWNPPRLIPAPNKNSSTATRPPSFYDKHFSKKVVRLPSLVQDLAKNVDKALDAALTTLPPLDGFITAKQRAGDIRCSSRVVTDEKAVANFYNITTARYCLRVASTLALHPSASFSQWRSLLCWTQSGYAIMDGQLCFIGEEGVDQTDETWAATVESMESKNRQIFEEMGKSMSPLATWEIKSTGAGPAEVMIAVLNLGRFSWTTCTASNCLSNLKHQKAKKNVELVVVGPDARDPPWSFPNDCLNISLVQENCDEEIDIHPLATLQQRPDTRRVTRSAASGSSAILSPQPCASHLSEHGSPTKDKGKKRKRDDDDEAYQNLHDKTAQSLVQQAWAQAVRVDGTLIVIHSGNHELVCIRHRGTQTLYVSDVIEPPYMMDRKLQLQSRGDGGDLISGVKDQDSHGHRVGRHGGGDVGKRKSGGFQFSTGGKDPAKDELVAIEKMIHVASNRNVVLLYLQYNVYDSPIPASFLRSAPSIMAHTRCPTPRFSPRAVRTYGLEECLTIVLTSEIGRGATGVVHRGTLKPEICDGAMPLDVVVKLAFDIEQRDALRSEYEVYRRLSSNGVLGIATILGLFDDSEDGACALVMLYAGVPLVKKPQRILSVSDRKLALSTLESIHRAGILHGDIRRSNILMGDLGITIIDFGHSEQCDDQEAKDKEIARLRNFLGLARESH